MRLTGKPFKQPRGWRPPTRKAFDPALGEVGSWVTFTDDFATITGQVWAAISGGQRARVWVADGTEYHNVSVGNLRPAVETVQEPLLAA